MILFNITQNTALYLILFFVVQIYLVIIVINNGVTNTKSFQLS